MTEPITREKNASLVVQMEAYPAIYEQYLKQERAFWTAAEPKPDIEKDDTISRLNEDERRAVEYVLTFFLHADSVVADNISEQFTRVITAREIKVAYDFQKMMENIHAQVYTDLAKRYVGNFIESAEEYVAKYPAVQAKIAWAQNHSKANLPLAELILVFICVEGIMFSSSFGLIFYFGTRHLLPGLIKANEFILRDELMHQSMGIVVYLLYIRNKVNINRVYEIFEDAVRVEKAFIDEMLPNKLYNMNREMMYKYVEYTADRLLDSLGVPKLYNTENPLDFMNRFGNIGQANFFEVLATDYTIGFQDDQNELKLNFDAE